MTRIEYEKKLSFGDVLIKPKRNFISKNQIKHGKVYLLFLLIWILLALSKWLSNFQKEKC